MSSTITADFVTIRRQFNQRKGDDGLGESNFEALSQSIERGQACRRFRSAVT